MAAPEGNTNASKWTVEATLEILEKIEYHAEDEDVFTLRRALLRSGVYQGLWSYWKKKWADSEEVMAKICFIDDIFIDKLMHGAITKRLHFGACAFALRVNHGLSDKPLKEGEKEPEEKIPVHLQAEIVQAKEEEAARPLPEWAAPLPKMYATVKPSNGTPYREIKWAGYSIYTTYSEEECEAAEAKVHAYQKENGVWLGWVLPEEEYVREKMKIAA